MRTLLLMNDLIDIRRHLHQIAELSGQEANTAAFVKSKLAELSPDEIIENLGGHGLAAVFDCGDGPATMLRADLDALPISEVNTFDYKSRNPKVSHKCGHDGHMTILIGLAREIAKMRDQLKGRIILLFQPAEETAEGARLVIDDEKFKAIRPDYVFGLHNLPGFPKSSIISRNDEFASASNGLKVNLLGSTSHAGHPENGNNPVLAMTSLIHGLIALPSLHTKLEHAANVTIIHARLGEIAFGTSPGEADVMATFRSHRNDEMAVLTNEAIKLINGIAATYELAQKTEWVEIFPATKNDNSCVETIEEVAENLDYTILRQAVAFPWSEDFGHFLTDYKGAFFGIGSGQGHPQLHNNDYDFPDDIIPTGISMFKGIINKLNSR